MQNCTRLEKQYKIVPAARERLICTQDNDYSPDTQPLEGALHFSNSTINRTLKIAENENTEIHIVKINDCESRLYEFYKKEEHRNFIGG